MSEVRSRDYLSNVPNWERMSQQFREAILLSNALPEVYPETIDGKGSSKKNVMTRREDKGIDKEREIKLDSVVSSLDGEEQDLYQDYLQRKHNYFVNLAKRYHRVVELFKNQRMLGKNNRGWQAVARHSLVMAELAGNLAGALRSQSRGVSNQEDLRIAGLLHDMAKRDEMEKLRSLQAENQAKPDGEKLTEETIYTQMAEVEEKKFRNFLNSSSVKDIIVCFLPHLADTQSFNEFIRSLRNIGDVGSMQMVEKGFDPETSPINSSRLLDNDISKILFYLDQIIKHTAIVSIKERFTDARRRYASPESQQSAQFRQMDNREKIALRIEQEFENTLGIKAEGMQEHLAKLFFEKLYHK